MKKISLIAYITLSVLLVGCSTTAIKPKGSPYTSTPKVKAGKAQIVFYSYTAVNGWIESAAIKVDSKKNTVGTLVTNQFWVYDIEPGEHRVWGESGFIDSPTQQNFEEGKTYYFRYISKFIPYASRTWLRPVDEKKAKEELASCCSDGVEIAK